MGKALNRDQLGLRRIGFAIRHLPIYAIQLADVLDSATLVRGMDEYGHFLLEPVPRSDFHPDAVAFHSEMLAANNRILYGGTTTKQDDDGSIVPAPRVSD